MVKSMFAGVAGLRTHQSRMDVTGNNIANVNTWGYKAATMSFKDAMYQTTSSGGKGNTENGGYGGTNANQIGYGVTTGVIAYDFTTGGMSPSSRSLDCMIDGTGFFIVGPKVSDGVISLDDNDTIKSNGLYLSRVGQFYVDNNGYLTDDAGNYVYGFVSNDISKGDDFNTTSLQLLKIPTTEDIASVTNKKATSQTESAKKAYEEAMALLNSLNATLGTARTEYQAAKEAYDAKATTLNISGLETTLTTKKTAMEKAYADWVDSPEDTTLKTAYQAAKLEYDEANYNLVKAQAQLRADQALAANSTALTNAWTAYQTAYNAYNAAPTDAAKKTALDTALAELEKLENAVTKIEDTSLEGKLNAAKQKADAASAKVAAQEKTVETAKNTLETARNSATTTEVSNADSSKDELAQLESYKIQTDGTLTAATQEGTTIFIGKIALAGVQNTNGLQKDTGYYYSISDNAGNVSVYEAGGTAGRILGNYLEMATVDLATEMTTMITTQRGFQANSKIITVTDQMLEELVNMKR